MGSADLAAPEVTAHINDQPYLSIKKILVPVKDKRKLREVLEDHEITCVINISRSRAPDTNDADYASRRAAVDFGIPVSLLYRGSIALTWLVDQQRQARGPLHRDATEKVPQQPFDICRRHKPTRSQGAFSLVFGHHMLIIIVVARIRSRRELLDFQTFHASLYLVDKFRSNA